MPLSVTILTLVLFVLCIFGYSTGYVAAQKDYSFAKWFWFGFFLFPLAFFKAKKLPEPDYFTLKRTEEKTNVPEKEADRLFSDSFLYHAVDLAAPVDLTGYDLYAAESGERFALAYVHTRLGQEVAALILSVEEVDEQGQVLQAAYPVPFDNLALAPGKQIAEPLRISLRSPQVRKLNLSVQEAIFTDHSSIQNRAPQWVSYDPGSTASPEEGQAMREYNANARCYPTKQPVGWSCLCGMLNGNEASACVWCGTDRDAQFADCRPERFAARIQALQAEHEAYSKQVKERFDERRAQEKAENVAYQQEVEKRRNKLLELLHRRKHQLLGTIFGVLAVFAIVSTGYKWQDQRAAAEQAELFAAKGQHEMAHDAYIRAGKKQEALAEQQLIETVRVQNGNADELAAAYPDEAAALPEGAVLCCVVDDQVFYRFDKNVWVKTAGSTDDRELFTYNEKGEGFVYLEGWFGVMQKNRLGSTTILLYELESGDTVSYDFPVKLVDLKKTTDNKLLVFFESETWPKNYYLVYRNFYGRWTSRRVNGGSYERHLDDFWYDVRDSSLG